MSEATDLVVERVLNAPRELVWKALTEPRHIKEWWAPRPYQTTECKVDLQPGGALFTRMTGPDGFNEAGASCILEVVPLQRLTWTSALLPGYRPALMEKEGCGSLSFTAIFALEDAGGGKTRYKATAMHANEADRETHAKMGFQEGWGTCAAQLEEVAAKLG